MGGKKVKTDSVLLTVGEIKAWKVMMKREKIKCGINRCRRGGERKYWAKEVLRKFLKNNRKGKNML